MPKKHENSHLDEFSILSAIWILSCNDENSIITYGGIKYRLRLDDKYELKLLVSSRGDLFRLKVPQSRLDKWKDEMLSGKHVPSFIYAISDKEKRKEVINSLSIEDVFRSQFRAEANAAKSSTEILNWGLQHIERLRQAKINLNEGRLKKASVLWIPITSLLVTLSITAITVYTTYRSQYELKKYEVTFKPKQENYSKFMQCVFDSFSTAEYKNRDGLSRNVNQLEITYFNIEPFLNQQERTNIYDKLIKFSAMCMEYEKIKENENGIKQVLIKRVEGRYVDSLVNYRKYFSGQLYPALFPDNK